MMSHMTDDCIWSRGYLFPFFWCKWYLVSSFQICVGGSNHNKISLVYHVISLVPVSSHILNYETSFYKTTWSEHKFKGSVSRGCPVSRDQSLIIADDDQSYSWGHVTHDVTWLFYSENVQTGEIHLYVHVSLDFVQVSFTQKQYDPQLTIDTPEPSY